MPDDSKLSKRYSDPEDPKAKREVQQSSNLYDRWKQTRWEMILSDM